MQLSAHKITSSTPLIKALHLLSWLVFVGLCIKTGSIVVSFFVSHFVNPEATKNVYMGLDLTALFNYNLWHYNVVMIVTIFVSGLKAFIFYLVIRLFLKINLVNPFSRDIADIITYISYVALLIGTLGMLGNVYKDWLAKQGLDIPVLESYLGGTGEFLFLAGVIYVIAQIFRRGVELQTENDLTV